MFLGIKLQTPPGLVMAGSAFASISILRRPDQSEIQLDLAP
jgi:hypothetical protein